jgi:hypothetical protein
MTDERDPKVSGRYRELGDEEPPRDLDERILAASRRSGRRDRYRWTGPLAAAAVLALAIGVALHVERPPPEVVTSRVEVRKEEAPAASPPVSAPDPRPQQPSRDSRARPEARSAPSPAPQAAPEPPAAADQLAAVAGERAAAARRDAQLDERQVQSRAAPAQLAKAYSPEQWLLAIDDLKRQGRHEEAEKQLAEFRKRYPDYRIPQGITEKFEKR